MGEIEIWRKEKPQEEDDANLYFSVDLGDRHFNDSVFGFSKAIPMDFKTGLRDLLHKFESLERYIDGYQDVECATTIHCNLDVSLEEALYYPKRISDRIPIFQEYNNQISPENLKFMWCRLVVHYFEYLYGVPEMKQLSNQDKVQLALHHISRIICLAIIYRTYKSNMRHGILLGGGIIFIPSISRYMYLGSVVAQLLEALPHKNDSLPFVCNKLELMITCIFKLHIEPRKEGRKGMTGIRFPLPFRFFFRSCIMGEIEIWRKEKPQEEDDANLYFSVDLGDRHFNDSVFGFSKAIPMDFKTGLRDLLHKFESLERYIDGYQDVECATTIHCNLDVSLEEALYYPKRISDRIPIFQEYNNQISPENLKFMWCRLVVHYFEYLYGVPEMKQLSNQDKVQLALHHISRIICLAIIYRTYKSNMRHGILLGGGIIFIPSRETDNELVQYMNDLEKVTQHFIVQEFRNIRLTEEEYILTKLICLFSQSDDLQLTSLGAKLCSKAHKRYLSMLKQCIQVKDNYNSHDKVIGRMQAILNVLPQLDFVTEVDDHHLSNLVKRGTVSLNGQLPTEIHIHSRRTPRQIL